MDPNSARRRRSLIWLIISQVLALASFLIWLPIALASDLGSIPEASTLVSALWSYPIIPLVLAGGAWIAFGFRRYLLANILSTIASLPTVLLYDILWWATLTSTPLLNISG